MSSSVSSLIKKYELLQSESDRNNINIREYYRDIQTKDIISQFENSLYFNDEKRKEYDDNSVKLRFTRRPTSVEEARERALEEERRFISEIRASQQELYRINEIECAQIIDKKIFWGKGDDKNTFNKNKYFEENQTSISQEFQDHNYLIQNCNKPYEENEELRSQNVYEFEDCGEILPGNYNFEEIKLIGNEVDENAPGIWFDTQTVQNDEINENGAQTMWSELRYRNEELTENYSQSLWSDTQPLQNDEDEDNDGQILWTKEYSSTLTPEHQSIQDEDFDGDAQALCSDIEPVEDEELEENYTHNEINSTQLKENVEKHIQSLDSDVQPEETKQSAENYDQTLQSENQFDENEDCGARALFSDTNPIENEDLNCTQALWNDENDIRKSDIENHNFLEIGDEISFNKNKFGNELQFEPKRRKVKADLKDHIVNELIDTEGKYIANLNLTIRNYKYYLDQHISESTIIFGNLPDLLIESQQFLAKLIETRHDYDGIGSVFLQQTHLFHLYPIYARKQQESNKLMSIHIELIEQRQEALKDKLGLKSHLLKPIQRITKYKLLLKQLKKQLNLGNLPSENVSKAIDFVGYYIQKTDDSVLLASIKNNPFYNTDPGNLLFQEDYKLMSPYRTDIVLFIFENCIILAEREPFTKDFIFKYRIHLELLTVCYKEEKLKFHLADFENRQNKYILKANTIEAYEKCRTILDNILMSQFQKEKGNQSIT